MQAVQHESRPIERLIRIDEVKRLTGLSTATLYRKITAKEFPRPVQLGAVARAWPLSEVQIWIAGRMELLEAAMTDAFKSDWEPGDFITTVTDDKTVDTGFAAALAGDNRRRSVEPRAAGVPTRAPGGRSMSTGNAMADVQTGQEVVLPERMPSEQTEPKFTADQIEKKCPDRLRQIGKEIAARLEKIDKQIKQAEDQSISVNQLIAQAKELCDEGGFNAFREKFFPNLGTSRVYELLAIASNKKTVEETRASNRLRVAKHRANKAEAPVSVTVTEKSEPEPGARGGPKEDDGLEATSTSTEHTTEQGAPKIEADNAEASTEKGKTECAKREAGRKPQAQKALDEFKYAVNCWLPQMDDDTKREAVEYAVAKSGVTVSCASDK